MADLISRRSALIGGVGAGGLLLSGCDQLSHSPSVKRVLDTAATLNYRAQRLLLTSTGPLAPEFKPADIAPSFRVNGSAYPGTDDYKRLMDSNFASYRLVVEGLVHHPLSFSLDDLRKLPSRTQITRHDCVEGWSCIGQWTGVQLGLLLKAAGLAPRARFVVFRCADDMGGGLDGPNLYYESVDLADAFHPQTILAYALNGQPLPVAHGAPIRLRVERQLGYKQAKYVMRIQVTDSFAPIGGGKGGFWEDQGYAWYAGI
jgi:DMSO/TMAO reductase YedYZ molybdopterin-dependent catalytic subunit